MEEDNFAATKPPTNSHHVEIRVRATKSSFGLIDHYYMILNDQEYHPGCYAKGSILPKDTTKGYHVAAIRTICQTCYDKIILNFNAREDKRIWSLYPFLNCESFSTGFSIQSLGLLAAPLIGMLIYQKKYIVAVIVLLLCLIAHLSISKFTFSRTFRGKCSHLT